MTWPEKYIEEILFWWAELIRTSQSPFVASAAEGKRRREETAISEAVFWYYSMLHSCSSSFRPLSADSIPPPQSRSLWGEESPAPGFVFAEIVQLFAFDSLIRLRFSCDAFLGLVWSPIRWKGSLFFACSCLSVTGCIWGDDWRVVCAGIDPRLCPVVGWTGRTSALNIAIAYLGLFSLPGLWELSGVPLVVLTPVSVRRFADIVDVSSVFELLRLLVICP